MDILTLLIACMVQGAKPSTEACTTRVSTETETAEFSEKFTLSLNDPVEFFRFQSRYRPFPDGGFYLLVPVLGDIRDRFLDQDPFNDTLFFTWMVGGAGFEQKWGPVALSGDAGLVYLKQRYAGNYVHTDEPREPALNQLYDFAQFAGATTAGVKYVFGDRGSIGVKYERIDLKSRGEAYSEEETGLEARVIAWRGESAAFGLYAQRYERVSGLRRDGNEDAFRLGRCGVFGEF